jgi:hypothetical protein
LRTMPASRGGRVNGPAEGAQARGRPDLVDRVAGGGWQCLFAEVLFRDLVLAVVPRGDVVRGEELVRRRRGLPESRREVRTVLGRLDGEECEQEEYGYRHEGLNASACLFARTVPRRMGPGPNFLNVISQN